MLPNNKIHVKLDEFSVYILWKCLLIPVMKTSFSTYGINSQMVKEWDYFSEFFTFTKENIGTLSNHYKT